MRTRRWRRVAGIALAALIVASTASCQWRGANSMPLPGTAGRGPGAFQIQAQLPDVTNLSPNSRVRVGDVTVGNVTHIEQQGWHALVTIRLDGDVELPDNATATVGQTSLLGSLHIELAPPTDAAPQGRLHNGSLIPLSSAGSYPTTEQTLAAFSMLLNNGGIGKVQDITTAFSTALAGRDGDVRSLIEQLNQFVATLNGQIDDIVAATESLNNLVGKLANQQPVLRKALDTIPGALEVVKSQRHSLTDVADQLGQFSALATETADNTKEKFGAILNQVGPVLKSLADAGPALTRSLDAFVTFPWPKSNLDKWIRGDYGNATAIFDLTLSRLDNNIFVGTRFEGALTELEMQWGRTIGQMPSPYTADNPLVAPYHFDQGR